jgi:integrase
MVKIFSQYCEEFNSGPSLMLLWGAKPKVISEALGHSSVAFTMDVYSHIIEGMQQDAMMLLDVVLPEAKNGVSARK